MRQNLFQKMVVFWIFLVWSTLVFSEDGVKGPPANLIAHMKNTDLHALEIALSELKKDRPK